MDLFPAKAQFHTGEPVDVILETDGEPWERAEAAVFRLNELVGRQSLRPAGPRTVLSLGCFDSPFAGYGVSVRLTGGGKTAVLETAFDVTDSPKRTLRYGFVSDFTPADADNGAMDWLRKCHINTVQFYDWSYRHDSLVSDSETYRDMMGKEISRPTVLGKVRRAKELGMQPIAYGAVYAASREFFEQHPDWAFYTGAQQPFVFIDVFYIMNIQAGSPWREHLIGEYQKALEKMEFSGIHMDTYGFPKTAFSHLRKTPEWVRLDRELPTLIEETREKLSRGGADPCLIFNNVGNWPTRSTAAAPQDAVYIEVWEPYDRYCHIARLIDDAKAAGGGKPVILAAYLPPFRTEERRQAMNAARLLTAAIVSHGATHLLLGENRAVLTQGYYSDYARLEEADAGLLRRYYDFLVRYLELFCDDGLQTVSMTHTGWDNDEYRCLNAPASAWGEAGKLWMIARERKERKLLAFVNLCGCGDDRWDRGNPTPAVQRGVRVQVQVDFPATGVYTASPDGPSLEAQTVPYTVQTGAKGCFVAFELPAVEVWRIVWIEMKGGNEDEK